MSWELSGGPQASLVSSIGVSSDMVNLTVSIIPLPAEIAR